jgi:diguanylate cyclase (GGDEF)-like protein/PAS domain S-box-containing protein
MPYLHRLKITLLLSNLFVIVLAAFSAYQGYRNYQEHAEVTTRNLAAVIESNLVNAIRRVDFALLVLLNRHEDELISGHIDALGLNRHIEQLRAQIPEVEAIRLTDAQGLLTFGVDVDRNARINLSDRPHFTFLRDHPNAAPVISKPQISRVNKQSVIVLARRITRPNSQPHGEFGGIIFATVTLDYFTQLFNHLDLGPNGVVFLRDNELDLIARHPEQQGINHVLLQKYVSPEIGHLIQAGQTTGTVYTLATPDHVARTLTFRKLENYPLYAFVGLATDDYLATWRHDAFGLGLTVVLFALASLYAARIQFHAWQRQLELNATVQRQEAIYHELVEDTPVMVLRYQPDTTITFANTNFAEFVGGTPETLLGKCWLDLIPEENDRTAARQRIAGLTPAEPVSSSVQHRLLGKDGQPRWTQWTDRAFFDRHGRLTHLQSIGEDITETKRIRDIQAARLRLMEFAIDHTMHELLVATLDEAGVLTESPIGFYHFLEADQKTLMLQAWSTRTSLEYCHAEGAGQHYNIDQAGVWVEAVRQRKPLIHNDYATLQNKRGLPPGHAELIREMVVPVFRKGLIVAILGVGNKATHYSDNDVQTISLLADLAWDFAESKRLEAELVEMATTDFLTGLTNRRHFIKRVNQELERLKRFDIPRAAVLMLDLDHFKKINDNYGHAAGDSVLKHFADLIRGELRQIDSSGRLGGEEFAILLLGTDIPSAEHFAERLRNRVADSKMTHDGQNISITVSIGIAALEASDASPEAAIKRADNALYAAKNQGRNRVCVNMDHSLAPPVSSPASATEPG